jgi:hypothetical protein
MAEPIALAEGTDNVRQLHIAVDDAIDENIAEHFPSTAAFIEEGRRDGATVFVHCQMGVSRSVSVVIAYLMSTYLPSTGQPCSAVAAAKMVSLRRPIAFPNVGFQRQLLAYEGALRSVSSEQLPPLSELQAVLRPKSAWMPHPVCLGVAGYLETLPGLPSDGVDPAASEDALAAYIASAREYDPTKGPSRAPGANGGGDNGWEAALGDLDDCGPDIPASEAVCGLNQFLQPT